MAPVQRTAIDPFCSCGEEFERAAIDRTLLVNKGDLTATANELGISRRALKRRLSG